MNVISFVDYLKNFGTLSTPLTESLLAVVSINQYPKKTILLKKKSICNSLYFLEKGLAKIYTEEDDKLITNDIVVDGELLVAFSSFISRKPSLETIELLEDSIIASVNYDRLQELYQKFPELERIGRLIAEHHYNALAIKLHQLRFSTTTQRYYYLLERKPEIIKRTPLGVIASYLGMSIENLSRVRSKL